MSSSIFNKDLENHNYAVDSWQKPAVDRETIAFLQYTSGSTGKPKGVILA